MKKILILAVVIISMISCEKEELIIEIDLPTIPTQRDTIMDEFLDPNRSWEGFGSYRYHFKMTQQFSDTSGLISVLKSSNRGGWKDKLLGYFTEDLYFIELYKDKDTLFKIHTFDKDTIELTYFEDLKLKKLWR
jgi:hypothetical protein